MKIKVSEASGPVLDWMVAIANGINPKDIKLPRKSDYPRSKRLYRLKRDEDGNLTGSYMTGPELLFSKMWESGGPIIERERISLRVNVNGANWVAFLDFGGSLVNGVKARMPGPTPLIAAMRCYVVSKLGEEVEVPAELLS